MPQETAGYTLIYDGTCPLCLGAVERILERVRPGSVDALPFQDPARAECFPQLSEKACREAIQLVAPDGTVYSGPRALARVSALTRRWRWLAWAFTIPGVHLVPALLYRWVARHRHGLSKLLPLQCRHLETRGSSSKGRARDLR